MGSSASKHSSEPIDFQFEPTIVHQDFVSSGKIIKSSSTVSSTATMAHLAATMESMQERSGLFYFLPQDICVFMLLFMDIPSVNVLAQTCKFWEILSRDDVFYRVHCFQRFNIDLAIHKKRLSFESFETNWKELYVRLDSGMTSWKGFAMDRATNTFTPYPMELIVSNVDKTIYSMQMTRSASDASFQGVTQNQITPRIKLREVPFDGVCRWKSVNDALTKASGVIIDDLSIQGRFEVDSWLNTVKIRTVSFQETEIIRGTNIAIPNKYFGMIIGPCMIGVFDPGHEAFVGVFALVMEESLPRTSMFIQRSPSSASTVETKSVIPQVYKQLESNGIYSGLLTFANQNQRRGFYCHMAVTIAADTEISGELHLHFSDPFRSILDPTLILTLSMKLNPNYCELVKQFSSQLSAPPLYATCTLGIKQLLAPQPPADNDIWTNPAPEINESHEWANEHISLSRPFDIMRFSDYLIGYMQEPKVGIFIIRC